MKCLCHFIHLIKEIPFFESLQSDKTSKEIRYISNCIRVGSDKL